MRCRLNLTSGGKSLEGFGCSPIKRLRELGLIRRESVWSLSSGGKIVKRVSGQAQTRHEMMQRQTKGTPKPLLGM